MRINVLEPTDQPAVSELSSLKLLLIANRFSLFCSFPIIEHGEPEQDKKGKHRSARRSARLTRLTSFSQSQLRT